MRFNVFLILSFVLWSCGDKSSYEQYHGEAQGTTFSISYDFSEDMEDEVDSVFNSMDALFSTYVQNSEVKKFNEAENRVKLDPDFFDLWEKCWELNIETDGLFDPTLGPLLSLYKKSPENLDSNDVERALELTGLPLIRRNDLLLSKDKAEVSLNFDAVAQGYTVDKISELFEAKGIENYMIEVGGEIRAKGRNALNKTWVIGIDKPLGGNRREIILAIQLDDKAMATSGNYRKFYVIDGQSFGHILNPKTGFPERSNILSMTVFSDECYKADAYATAMMSLSLEEIKDWSENKPDISVIALYTNGTDTLSYMSRNLESLIVN
jgi:thiamine biosynthesis lipoprotein